MKELKLKTRSSVFIASLLAVLVGGAPLYAIAATLSLTPNSGTYGNEQFSADVNVASPDDEINAVSGTIAFPAEKLQVVSANTNSSVIDTWITKPTYSNTDGKISFDGIILGKAFKGPLGKVLGIIFQAKSKGVANTTFTQAAVLKNDESGTDVLSDTGTATYTLNFEAAPPTSQDELHSSAPSTTALAKQLPAGPKVSSPTHPDSEQWYADNNPTFNWKVSNDIIGVNIYGDHNPTTKLNETSYGLFNSYTYNNVADGVWYVHIRLKNKAGWGNTTHKKFMIASKNAADLNSKNQVQPATIESKATIQSASTTQEKLSEVQRPSASAVSTTSESALSTDSQDIGLQIFFTIALILLFSAGILYKLKLSKVVTKEQQKSSLKPLKVAKRVQKKSTIKKK